jgi:hypothetical protein
MIVDFELLLQFFNYKQFQMFKNILIELDQF